MLPIFNLIYLQMYREVTFIQISSIFLLNVSKSIALCIFKHVYLQICGNVTFSADLDILISIISKCHILFSGFSQCDSKYIKTLYFANI